MEEKKTIKTMTGIVVSDKMNKTIVVKIENKIMHKLYKKYIKRTRKFKAHDEKNECKIGDIVKISHTRPISKEKCWNVIQIIQKAK